jgi:hypothetical protein
MRVASSALLTETLLQFVVLERSVKFSLKHEIFCYFRYFYDIHTKYHAVKTDIHTFFTGFNHVHPKLQFTLEKKKRHN